MSVDLRIADELKTLGYRPQIVEGDTPNGRQKVVTFPYRIHTGRFKGKTRTVGVSTYCEAVGYPEVPPHWVFVSPPIVDTQDGANHGVFEFDGGGDSDEAKWVALSRPPGAFWDKAGHKGMKAYLEHLSKVFARI